MTDGQIEFNAGAPIQLLLKRWRMLVAFLVVGGIAGIIYTQFSTAVYASQAVLFLPQSGSGTINPLTGTSNAGQIGNMLKGIIQSRNSQIKIADRLNIKPRDINLNVVVDDKTSQVMIQATHTNKQLSLDVTTQAVLALKAIRREVNTELGNTRALLLQQAVSERELELAEAQRKLIDFQKNMKTAPDPNAPYSGVRVIQELRTVETELEKLNQELQFRLDAYRRTAESAIQMPTELPMEEERQRLEQLEFELNIQEIEFGPRHPTIVKLKEQIRVAREALQNQISDYLESLDQGLPTDIIGLEARKRVLEWQKETLEELSASAPEEAVEFAVLQGEVDAQATLLKQARAQLEEARFDTQVDRINWSVLDEPYTNNTPINKSKFRNGAVGGFLGVVIAILFVLATQARRPRRRTLPTPPA